MPQLRSLFALLVCTIVVGCASPKEMLGWAEDVPFTLTPAEVREFTTVAPVFNLGLAEVNFGTAGVQCLMCGDFSDTNGIGEAHVRRRLQRDFPALLRTQMAGTTLFPPGGEPRLTLRGSLVKLDQQSSVGAAAERKSVLSSGDVHPTRITSRYELLDRGQLMDQWDVTTSARSNSLVASTRLTENIDGALKRNLRALLLRIVIDHSPADAPRANRALAALQSEVDNKRIALGYVVYGTTKTVTTTAGLIGDGLMAVAQNGDVVAAGLNSTSAAMERSNRDYNDARMKIAMDSRARTSAATESSSGSGSSRSAASPSKVSNGGASTSSSPAPSVASAAKPSASPSAPPAATPSAPPAAGPSTAPSVSLADVKTARLAPPEPKKAEPAPAPKKPKVEWGPLGQEAIAVCRQNTKTTKWVCNGALDNQIIVDEPTLESALARQHCKGGTWAAGGPMIDGVQWEAYRCGHALGAGDYDVAKRYGLITARRSYMCPKFEAGDGRCATVYDGQDKRE